ncbi:MAG: hypothetical protein ACXQTS_00380 [Candidatus Methanospirareceae archaeon]
MDEIASRHKEEDERREVIYRAFDLLEPLLTQGATEEGRKEIEAMIGKTWFGTASRQGALHFSFLRSEENIENILSEPVPLIAVRDDNKAVSERGDIMAVLENVLS